jgi:hypothetical protein
MTVMRDVTTRFDALDREAFKAMIESDGFRNYLDRLKAERARAEDALLRAYTPLDLHRAQGAAQALSTAIALPARMLEEMQNRKS